MRDEPRWLVYTLEERDGKFTKLPRIAADPYRKASSTDPNTWGTFEQAIAAFDRESSLKGLGFVLGDGWTGVDIDHAIFDGEATQPIVGEVVQRLDSYTELSPSGTGLHIIMRGDFPNGRKWPELGVEAYGQGRFFTVTGRVWGDVREPANRQAELEHLASDLDARTGRAMAPSTMSSTATGMIGCPVEAVPQPLGFNGADEDLLRAARAAQNGAAFTQLFDHGDLSAHSGDESAADLALLDFLAFWCGPDPERIERLFSRSALGQREKWLGRSDYRTRSIEKVLRGPRQFHSAAGGSAPSTAYRRPNLREFIARPEPEWLVQGLLKQGGIGMLWGEPGTGKSFLGLGLALCALTGKSWVGFDVKVPDDAKVVYIMGEDSGDTKRRVEAWAQHHDMKLDDLPLDRFEVEERRIDFNDATGAKAFADSLPTGTALVVADTFASVYTGSEIDNHEQQEWLNHVRDYVEAKGAAVLLIHHANATGGRERGTTNLKGAMDVSLGLKAAKNGELYMLCCSKPPKSAPAFKDIPLRRVAVAGSIVFEVARDAPTRAAAEVDGPPSVQKVHLVLSVSEGRSLSVRQLEDATKLSRSTVNDALARLCGNPASWVVRSDRAKFRLVPPAERTGAAPQPQSADAVVSAQLGAA